MKASCIHPRTLEWMRVWSLHYTFWTFENNLSSSSAVPCLLNLSQLFISLQTHYETGAVCLVVHLYLLSCLKRCIWNCLPLCSLLFCSASWMLSRLYCNQEFTSASWMHQKKDGEAGRSCGMSLFCCYLLQEARLQHITYLQFLCYLYFNQWWRKETPLKRLSHLTKTSLVNSVVSVVSTRV